MNHQDVLETVVSCGADRVVINNEGEAVAPSRAPYKRPSIVFVRGDGWTLAADERFPTEVEVAWHLWRDEWVGVIRLPIHDDEEPKFVPMDDAMSRCCSRPAYRVCGERLMCAGCHAPVR